MPGPFDAAPCGHLRLDVDGVILGCNRGVQRLVGRTEDELVGARLEVLFGAPSRIFVHTHVLPTVRALGQVSEIQVDLRTAEGRDVPVLWNAVLHRDLSPPEIEVVLVEMRQRAEFEGELLRAKQAAEAARREKDGAISELVQLRKLESLSSLAGGVAHDFNNLLCVILGNAQLMHEAIGPNDPVRPLLTAVDTAARRAAEIAGQMLSYSGRASFVLTPVVLDDVLEGLRPALASLVPEGAALGWSLAGERALVDGDREQLRRLLSALVTNAVEACEGQACSVHLRTAVRTFDVAELAGFQVGGATSPGPYAVLEIADAGCGMDPATRDRLFEPFFSTKAVGRGLGLPTALGIVRAHRGAVRVHSARGLGTTLTIAIPQLGRAEARPAERPAERAAPRGDVLLVVDDEQAIRTLLQRGLGRAGYEVLVAADGAEALEVFAGRPDIACVLVDLTMPGMAGDDVLVAMRAQRPELPAVVMSGFTDAALSSRLGAMHRTVFRDKPFAVRDVADLVRGLLGPAASGV